MQKRPLNLLVAAAILLYVFAWGCGSTSSSPPPPPPSSVSVSVTPPSVAVQVGATQQFFATVTGTSNTAVNWNVNGIPDGNATFGTITSAGLYTAPSSLPSSPGVLANAVSQADTSKSGSASVLIVGASVGDVNQARQSFPIKLGTSGGNQNDLTTSSNRTFCCSGTLGALVTRGQAPSITSFILSNNHVLARSGQASPGDVILQPGLADTNCTANGNTVAHLSQAAPLRTSNVDAAIAEVVSGAVDLAGAILLFGSVNGNTIDPAPPASSLVKPAIGMPVAKSGRSTGLTCSSVGAINASVQVDYQTACNSGTKFTVIFTNQVVVSGDAFSSSGDSGSLIVNSQTAEPVGLLFAGNTTNTVANPIQDVLAALNDPNTGAVPAVIGGAKHLIACPSSPTTTPAQAATLSEARLAIATAAKNKFADQLMTDPAVIGVGVGASDDHPGEPAVLIYVEKGKTHAAIPAELDGVRTKVIFTDRFRAQTTGGRQAEALPSRPSLSEEEVARALAVKEKHFARLMADPAMIGVGVGASQDSPGEAALVLYIEKGRAAGVIPVQMDGVRTRVIRTDRFRAFGWNETTTTTCRPKP